jgi:hemerythrin-like domain-containing protein
MQQTDAVGLLMRDHETVRQLFKKLDKANKNESSDRRELVQQIESELKAHTQIEEEIFYPAFREAARSDKDEDLYFEAIEEHHVVKLIMPEIDKTDTDAEQFTAKCTVLKEMIEHHVEEEESEMFPKARRFMGRDQLQQLGEQMQQRKDQLLGNASAQAARGDRSESGGRDESADTREDAS